MRPGFRFRCNVLGRRTWLANLSSTIPPPPRPPGPAHDRCRSRSSMRAGGMPNSPKMGRMAVRKLSTDTSPVPVADVMTPGPENRTFMCALENGARRQSGRRKYVTPLVHVAGMLCSMTSPSLAPNPGAAPVIRPGLKVTVVPVYDICMELPLVMASSRRRKETSWGARPGCVGDELRILEICTGRPVRVDRTSRWTKDLCPVKRRNSGKEVDMAVRSLMSVGFLKALSCPLWWLQEICSFCRGFPASDGAVPVLVGGQPRSPVAIL